MTPVRSLPVLLALLAACDAGGGAAALARSTRSIEPTVRDSGGVSIYELPADALERAPLVTMDSTPLAVIGSDDPDEDVSKLANLTFLPDNRAVGFDAADNRIVVFGSDGRELRRIGRRGQGPGEFAGVSYTAVIPGDTVVVSDGGNSRVTLIAPDSGFVRDFPARLNDRIGSLGAATRLRDGRWALLPEGFKFEPQPGVERPLLPIIAVAESSGLGGACDTLGFVEGIRAIVVGSTSQSGKQGITITLARFTAFPRSWPLADGFAVLPGDGYLARLYDAEGRMRASLRVAGPRVAVTPEINEAGIREDLARYRRPGAEVRADQMERVEEELRKQPVADSLPAIGLSLPAGDRLWIQDYPDPRFDQVGYTAIDTAGRAIGRLVLARTARPVAFSQDRVAIRTEDADGIVRYEIHKLHFPAFP